MRTRSLHRVGSFAVFAVAASTLVSCAAEPGYEHTTPVPTMAPPQSIDEACAVSRDQVDQLVAETRAEIEATVTDAAESVQAGRLPDVSGISALASTLGSSLDTVRSHVDNPEVAAVLDDLDARLGTIGAMQAPESLLAVPGYVTGLGSELTGVLAAGRTLQSLCVTE